MPPKKRSPEEISQVAEPHLTPTQFDAWHDGIELFDAGAYWKAHERWEDIWKEMGNAPEDDAEIVVRAFIQLAAALHLTTIGRLDGARSNFAKAARKFDVAPALFLGVNVTRIREMIPRQVRILPELAPFSLRPSDAIRT